MRAVFLALLGLVLAAAAPARAADDLHFFRILTGSAASTYFPVGAALATVISSPPGSPPCDKGGPCGVKNLVAVAQTSEGSVANVLAIASDKVDSGLALADISYWAFHGEQSYFRRAAMPSLRVIANLYPETIHLVARRGAQIKDIRDLIGKRVSIDKPGSGTRLNAEILLPAYGVRLNQLKPLEVDPGEAIAMLTRGELDAFFLVAGFPAASVADLAEQGLIDLVALSGRRAEAALKRHRFFGTELIPAGTYKDIPETPTLSIGAQWVVNDTADTELIYQITKALWRPENRALLDAGHAKGQQIQLGTALTGISIPLHPGAEKYYREVGVISDALTE